MPAHKYIKGDKNSENTDKISKNYQTNTIKRLTLYHIGTSNFILKTSEIERKIKKDYRHARPNYVYEILKQLAPASTEYPYKLLFTYDDFFEKNGEKKFDIENLEKLKEKIKLNVFRSYGSHLKCESTSDLEYRELITNSDKLISILIRKTKDNSNFIKINLRSDISSSSNFAKIYFKDIEIPLIIKIRQGKISVYSIKWEFDASVKCYLDKIPYKCFLNNIIHNQDINSKSINNTFNSKASKISNRDNDYGYFLNVRGLMLFLILIRDGNNVYKKINKIIRNLSHVDNYWSMVNEFKIHDFKINDLFYSNKIINTEELYKHKIKERFPFLSNYNYYKGFLPRNFTADILLKISKEVENKLKTMDMTELKYKVTERFFEEIENYFWKSGSMLYSKIEYPNSTPDLIFESLRDYQKEIRTYLTIMKEQELKGFIEDTESYNESNSVNEYIRQILQYLNKYDKPTVSIKDIFYPNNNDSSPIELVGPIHTAIEQICANPKSEYVTNSGFYLIKKTEIEKIKKLLKPKMTLDNAKEIIRKHVITNESAVNDVLILSRYKAVRDRDTKQKVIVEENPLTHNKEN